MEQENPVFTQKVYGRTLKFRFGEEQLTYTLSDRSGEKEFSVFYETININDPTSLFVRSRGIRVALGLGMIAGGIGLMILNADRPNNPASAVLLLVLAAVFIYGQFFLKKKGTRYTVYPTSNKGPIQIIHNADYEQINGELRKRWAARLKKLHGSVNYSNDITKEQQKFQWLKQHQVISEEEYQDATAKLQAFYRSKLVNQPTTEEKKYIN